MNNENSILTPDNFQLTPEEQTGIDIARATSNAADPRTQAAIDSIVARYPKLPVVAVSVLGHKRNTTYSETGGQDALHVGFQFDYEYRPVTFICTVYGSAGNKLPILVRWTAGSSAFQNGSIGLAFANATGGVSSVYPSIDFKGELCVGVSVEYDISQYTRYRNVGIGLLTSPEMRSPLFTLESLGDAK